MASSDAIACQNCDQKIDRLGEAYVWLDRPVCKACFKRLAATRSLRYQAFWMPAALALLVVAIALAVLLAVKTQAAEQHAGDDPAQEQGRTVVAAGATAASSSAAAGMTREQAMDVFRADRTWYSHWEKKDRKKPLKWTVNGDTIVAGSDVDKPGRLEQRWVLLMDGHLFVIMDDQTLTGFFARTGRAKGYFTDDSPQAK